MDTYKIAVMMIAIPIIEIVMFIKLFAPIHAAFKRVKNISEWTEIVLSVYVTSFTWSIIILITIVVIHVCVQASSGRPVFPLPLETPTVINFCTVLVCSLGQMVVMLVLGKVFSEIKADYKTKEGFPSERRCGHMKKAQPTVPIDLPAKH